MRESVRKRVLLKVLRTTQRNFSTFGFIFKTLNIL